MKSWSLKMKIEPQHWIKMDAWKHPFRWPSLKFEPHPPRDGSPSKMTQGIHRHWNYPKAPHRLSFRGSCCGRSWRRGRGKGLLPVLLWDAGILDKPVYMTSTRSVKGRPVLFKKKWTTSNRWTQLDLIRITHPRAWLFLRFWFLRAVAVQKSPPVFLKLFQLFIQLHSVRSPSFPLGAQKERENAQAKDTQAAQSELAACP